MSPQQSDVTIMSPTTSIDPTEQVSQFTPKVSSIGPSRARPPAKRQKCRADQVLATVQQKLNQPQPVEDQFDIIAKNIAHKLRALPQETAIIAEKCVMDVLYEAHLGNLHKDSRVNIRRESSLTGSTNYSQGPGHAYIPQNPHPGFKPQFDRAKTALQTLSSIAERVYPVHTQYFEQSLHTDAERDGSQYANLRSYVSGYAPN